MKSVRSLCSRNPTRSQPRLVYAKINTALLQVNLTASLMVTYIDQAHIHGYLLQRNEGILTVNRSSWIFCKQSLPMALSLEKSKQNNLNEAYYEGREKYALKTTYLRI